MIASIVLIYGFIAVVIIVIAVCAAVLAFIEP